MKEDKTVEPENANISSIIIGEGFRKEKSSIFLETSRISESSSSPLKIQTQSKSSCGSADINSRLTSIQSDNGFEHVPNRHGSDVLSVEDLSQLLGTDDWLIGFFIVER